MSMAEMRSVFRVFDNGIEALGGFDLKLNQAERVSLLGPSGCGKSTALRILAGLDEPTSGTVSTNLTKGGVVGFVFQDATLLPWTTVEKNVAMPLKIQGMDETQRLGHAREMLERIGLMEFSSAYPSELSGGMKMRVSIARALVTRPALLLMDEPFAALDEITRFKLNDMLLDQQAKDQFSLLFVTHSVFESVYLSDRILVMSPRPGKVAADIAVGTDMKRDAEYRLSSSYIKQCRNVSRALDVAMNHR